MTLNPLHLLFRPRGRLDRPSFAVALVLFLLVSALATWILRALDPATAAGFWFGLVWFLLFFYMLYSVFGQRLHDMGRSVWPLTGLLFALFLLFISVAMAYGGAEYMSEYSQFDRKEVIDPSTVERLDETYRTELAAGGERTLRWGSKLLAGAFTLWLLVWPGQAGENRYGGAAGASNPA